MSVAALLLGLLAFILVLRRLKAAQTAGDIIETTHGAIGVMTNPDLGDEETERQVRRASLELLGKFFRIAATCLAAFATSALLVWGGAFLGLYALDRAIAIAVGWPFILGSSAAAVVLWLGLDRLSRRPPSPGDPVNEDIPYGRLDIALHDFAFASLDRQRALGRFESALLKHRIDMGRAKRPVFVTSLPRAGTTILLEAFAGLPQFASATYRHMPFTLSPLLWGAMSGAFRKSGEKTERAHGDGIDVGFDSPEAFEEMLWMAFWPEHYRESCISPWNAKRNCSEFEAYFRTHMAKVVATKPGATRYLSKNNANITRLGLIQRLFPDASILVPVRNPRAQVCSLLRQHLRFGDLHAREPFSRRYMEGIGHFEFGEALRPIAFDAAPLDRAMARCPEFWLRYWIAAYEHVLITAGHTVVFIDCDALCADPVPALTRIAGALELENPSELIARSVLFRPPRPVPELADVSVALMQRADDLYAALRRRSISSARLPVQGFAT